MVNDIAQGHHRRDGDQNANLVRFVMQLLVATSVVARRLDLTTTDVQVIASLWLDGPCDLSDLGDRAGVSRSGMTGLVRRLERAGLVHRTQHPFDGRRSTIDLVTGSQSPMFEALRHVAREHVMLLDDMSPADVRTVLDFAHRSTVVLAAVAGEDAPVGGLRKS